MISLLKRLSKVVLRALVSIKNNLVKMINLILIKPIVFLLNIIKTRLLFQIVIVFIILSTMIYLIDFGIFSNLKTLERTIDCYFNFKLKLKEIEGLNDTFFSSIITISVLSLTILSIVLTTDYNYFGVEFRKYITYESFPIKYRDLLIVSFLLIVFSIYLYIENFSVLLLVSLIFIVIMLLSCSIIYFMYLMNEKKIKSFLLKEKTLSAHSEEILAFAYKNYNEGIHVRSEGENHEILAFIKEIKEGNI